MKRRSSLISKPIDPPKKSWFEDNICETPERVEGSDALVGLNLDEAEANLAGLMEENDTPMDPKCEDWPEDVAEMPGALLVSAVGDLLSELEELYEVLSLRRVSNSTSSSQASAPTVLPQPPKTV